MQAVLMINFTGGPGLNGDARIDVDLPFAPVPEIAIGHTVWEDPRKPLSVSYDLLEKCFHVFFESEQIKSKEELDLLKKTYSAAEWNVR